MMKINPECSTEGSDFESDFLRFRSASNSLIFLAALLACVLLSCAPAFAEAPRHIHYLYVESNEGDSSGGHAGIRFDKYTFHFQHEDPGIIRVRRYDSTAFEYAYAKLGNRPIHESSIAVSPDTYRALEDAFSELLVIQEAQLGIRDDLQRDVALLQALLDKGKQAEGAPALQLKALGYFLPEISALPDKAPKAAADGPAPALASLVSAIEARYGAGFVGGRIETLHGELRGMRLHAGVPVPISRDNFPAAVPSDISRFYHRQLALLALEVLDAGLWLRPESYWMPSDDLFQLQPEDARQLAQFRDRLQDDLVRLANSTREDWALPFLVGMARLSALDQSLASGRLVLLNLFPEVQPEKTGREVPADAPYLVAMERDLRRVFVKRRAEFFDEDERNEAKYTSLERAGNLLLEVERARASDTRMRLRPSGTYPSREARLVEPLPVQMDAASLSRELERAREAEARSAKALSGLYAYNLLQRNCVTEIFSVVNRTMERLCGRSHDGACTPEMVREESVRRLGGYVDPGQGMSFIPVLSAREVNGNYQVVERQEKLAYRREAVARMKEREPALKVFLRESNTITSTVYQPGPEDSAFLFFTDDTVVLRPVFGAFNLCAGVGQTLFGLVTMPVRGPEHFLLGLRGVLFSLPELAFFNIRKGSMAYVERAPK